MVQKRSLFGAILALVIMLSACQQQASDSTVGSKTKLPAPELKRMSYELYGLDVESKDVIQGTLGSNQFMQDVLREHGVEPSLIDGIEKKASEVFDVRKMRAGNPFTLVKNSYNEVDFFIYEKTLPNLWFMIFGIPSPSMKALKMPFAGTKKSEPSSS